MSSPTPPDDAGLGLFSGSGDGDPPPRERKRRWPKRLLISVVVLVVLVALAGGLYAFTISRSFTHNLNRSGSLPPDTPTAPGSLDGTRPKKSPDDSVNYVLVGSDSRNPGNKQSNARSDTLMMVHLDSDRHAAYVISFPRDMYVKIPGKGKNKINAAYAFGGTELAVRTLEELTDVRMDHVLQIDFTGFIELTKQLGGVTVTNSHAFTSHGHRYPKGKITIEGKQALRFVRERHKLPHGDLDRAKNQRKVVQAILAKGMSKDTIRNPVKFTRFVSGVAKHITADRQLSNSKIRKTALSLRMGSSDVHQIQAPIAGFKTVHGVGSIDVVDTAKMAELSTALQNDELAAYAKKHPS